MTIPKMDSKSLNNILTESKEKIDTVDRRVSTIKNDIEDKIRIINHEVDYIQHRMDIINHLTKDEFNILNNSMLGQYESYGTTLYPKSLRPENNIYNLKVVGNNKFYFRNDVNCYCSSLEQTEDTTINDLIEDSINCTSVLMHDTVKEKEIFFEEFDKSEITLIIKPDKNETLGPSYCNAIELDPFLHGSFDIEKITLYGENKEEKIFKDIKSIGKLKLIWEKPISIDLIAIKIKLNYKVNKHDKIIYPFGLKHLYLIEAGLSSSSFVIINVKKDKYISKIDDTYIAKTLEADTERSLKNSEIEVFIDEKMQIKINPENEISRNTKDLYIKVPLRYESLIGLKFNVTTRIL